MGKASGHKIKLLLLSRLLMENSDKDHPIPLPQLLTALERAGVAAERKSVYADLEALQEFGLDVQFQKKPPSGWFVGKRDFELAELKFLVDAVQSSRFITRKKSDTLIRKIAGLTSQAQAKQLRRQVYVDRRLKTDNEYVYKAIDRLHNAIGEGLAVTFKYFDYNVAKKKVFRRGGKLYTVSPYGLIWGDENYYLVGWEHGGTSLRHYRVDKMSYLEITGQPRQGDESCKSFDLVDYGRRHFHMFSGRQARVRLLCENRLVNVILDRFGQEIMLIPQGADRFSVTVDAVVSPQFYGWLFGLGGGVVLTDPDWAVEEYRQALGNALAEIDRSRQEDRDPV